MIYISRINKKVVIKINENIDILTLSFNDSNVMWIVKSVFALLSQFLTVLGKMLFSHIANIKVL